MELRLTSPVSPSVNHYLGWRGIMKNGKPMAVSYKKPDATKYQKEFSEYVKEEVKKQGWEKSDNKFQHYYMDCTFYFDKMGKDANNSFKCLADALTDSGVVWIDDTQLCERVQGIFYDADNPRIELCIHPVDYVGIFDDHEQMHQFEEKCKKCKRYTRNCSILNKAKEGRIQEEIQDMVCSKYKE